MRRSVLVVIVVLRVFWGGCGVATVFHEAVRSHPSPVWFLIGAWLMVAAVVMSLSPLPGKRKDWVETELDEDRALVADIVQRFMADEITQRTLESDIEWRMRERLREPEGSREIRVSEMFRVPTGREIRMRGNSFTNVATLFGVPGHLLTPNEIRRNAGYPREAAEIEARLAEGGMSYAEARQHAKEYVNALDKAMEQGA